MLDYRHETFLTLCTCNSYTKTAEILHITQLAVSQHIKYLETLYRCKLIDTNNRKINITPAGKLLQEFATTIFSDSKNFKEIIKSVSSDSLQLNFGATLSIGEYVMPTILSRLLTKYLDMNIHMSVSNTHELLEQLNNGNLDFILVEGLFDKSKYDSKLFSIEEFVAVCSPQSEFAQREVSFNEITKSRIILRERGSGTREVFENILQKNNYSLNAFKKVIEIGNMTAIKELVSKDHGITFLYEVAAKKEIENNQLTIIKIPEFLEHREFNFVQLKESFYKEKHLKIYNLLKSALQEIYIY